MFVITYKKILLLIGLALVSGSFALLFTIGLKIGIDFTGGALTEVSYDVRPDRATLETKLDTLDLGGYSLRETTDESGRPGFILRTRDLAESERIAISDIVTSEGEAAEVSRFTSIGPVIGQELRDKAYFAIGGVVLIIVLYVAFAFRGVSYPVGSWVYGSITIMALIHDVLLPAGLMVLLGHFYGIEIDVLFVMALLAVLGYSVNDTIVVFDRVRENLVKYRQEKKQKKKVNNIDTEVITYKLTKPFDDIVGISVKETLVRSVNTSLTTLFALGALYYLGGDVTQTFALILMAGVIAGTYSSICLATPMLTFFAKKQIEE